jgi:hypothetical protein
MEVIAYQYEAAVHCIPCARGEFGARLDDESAVDSEGNNVHPIFDTDEVNLCGESCGTCWEWAIAPVEHEPASCLLVSDCRLYGASAATEE